MSARPALQEVAPGVHRLQHAQVNAYLLREGDELTLIDAALPRSGTLLRRGLDELGLAPSAIRALVLTHAHFDHLGLAHGLQRVGVPVHAHRDDFFIAAHPYRYEHERNRPVFLARHWNGARIVTRMALAGALEVRGVEGLHAIADGEELDVPGRPRVVATPGHTEGHCALHLPASGAVLSGDALVTLDPYTGRTGPRIVPGAATADSERALASLSRIAELEGDVLLPGHGHPWRGRMRDAVEIARSNAVGV